jgi:AcrR family transcriptional regulator
MAGQTTQAPGRRLTKKQLQGENSRELILDTAEQLMATGGYAATTINDIRNGCGLPPSSIYWHFGSKEGLLAAVMERGARRWFASIPSWDELGAPPEVKLATMLRLGARALSEHPEFLRLFYMLALERSEDPAVARIVRRVRDTAIERFRDGIRHLIPEDMPAAKARRLVDELTTFSVALSDGCFFADHLEPATTDVRRLYKRLGQALEALIPAILRER